MRSDIDGVDDTMYNGEPLQQRDADARICDEVQVQRKDSIADTVEEQTINAAEKQTATLQQSQPLFTTPHRLSVIREMSVESSMTFCTADQSIQRQKNRAMRLINKPLQLQHSQQRSMPSPDASVTLESGPHKKRKTISSQFQLPTSSAELMKTFAVPALPHRLVQATSQTTPTEPSDVEAGPTSPSPRLTAPKVDRPIAPAALAQVSEVKSVPRNPNTRVLGARAAQSKTSAALFQPSATKAQPNPVQDDRDVDMEDNIVVTPKHARTTKSLQNIAALSVNSPMLSISHFNRIADEVLRDIDVDTPTETEPSQPSQPLQPLHGQDAAVEVGNEQPRKTKLPRYTAEQRSWLFEHVKNAGRGKLTTVFPDLTRQFNKKFNEQRTEAGIAIFVTRLRTEYHSNNGNQKHGGGQDGRLSKKTQAKIKFAAELESQEQVTPSSTKANSDVSHLRSITRVGLLSQFKARTGEMQRSEGSQSPEQSDRAGK